MLDIYQWCFPGDFAFRSFAQVIKRWKKEGRRESDTSAAGEVCSAEECEIKLIQCYIGGEESKMFQVQPIGTLKLGQSHQERVTGKKSMLQDTGSRYLQLENPLINSIIFKSNMPQLLRSKENITVPSKVIKVTPDQLKALIRQGRTGPLIASTMTLTDSGQSIIRPVLLPLNH